MSDKQPEAVRLAEHLEAFRSFPDDAAAAEELRRLYGVNQELLEALEASLALIDLGIPFEGEITRKVRAAIAKATGSEA